MSIEARVAKLEQRNAGFVVSWPVYLDHDGNKIKWGFDMDEDAIQAIRFMTGPNGGHLAGRLTDEPYEKFSARAHHEAAQELNVTLFAHPAMFKL